MHMQKGIIRMTKRIVPYFRYMEIQLLCYQYFRIFPFAWLIVAQAKSEVNGKNDR